MVLHLYSCLTLFSKWSCVIPLPINFTFCIFMHLLAFSFRPRINPAIAGSVQEASCQGLTIALESSSPLCWHLVSVLLLILLVDHQAPSDLPGFLTICFAFHLGEPSVQLCLPFSYLPTVCSDLPWGHWRKGLFFLVSDCLQHIDFWLIRVFELWTNIYSCCFVASARSFTLIMP